MRRPLVLFLLLSGLVLLVTLGGRLLDLAGINRISLQTLIAEAAAPADEPEAWTENGACRLAHATGRLFMVRQQYAQALPYLERGVACRTGRPADQWAWFDLAQTQLAIGDKRAAARSFANADGYGYVSRLAQLAAADKDGPREIEMWRLAIEVDPGRHIGYIKLASLYVNNDPGQAEALFQQAINNNPRDRAAYLALANFYSGRGQLDAAGAVLAEALVQLPEDREVLQALAANAGTRGEISQAIDYYQQVAALSETEAQRSAAYFAVGNLAAADDNRASALSFYRLAVAGDPEMPAYLLALGQAYQLNGCAAQAGQLYQRLLALSPDGKTVAAVEAGLAELAGQMAEPAVDCPPLP